MAPIQSNLSDLHYGYDFVVATTQASINSGLITYLLNTNHKQPATVQIFLADETGSPTKQCSLEEFLAAHPDAVNPFDIPDGTAYTDPRITALTKAKVVSAVRIQVGMPPGCYDFQTHKISLPEPVVTMDNGAKNVLFNMYCAEATIIRNSPPSGFSNNPPSWKWYSQSAGDPWYIQTRTDLMVADLSHELDTPYFDNHPDQKAAVMAKLGDLTNYSLQQLLFDLDSASAQSVPTFHGVLDPGALKILRDSFINIWSVAARSQGSPLLNIAAITRSSDSTSLILTAMERWVSPAVDLTTGNTIQNPTANDLNACTLNYLCAADHDPLPAPMSFNWNWVDPQDIAQYSGAVAIHRKVIGGYLAQSLMARAKMSCFQPSADTHANNCMGSVTYTCNFQNGHTPQLVLHDTPSPIVASLTYTSLDSRSHSQDLSTYGEFNVQCFYTCDVVLADNIDVFLFHLVKASNKFRIVQRLIIHAYMQYAGSGTGANIFDKTLTDEYVVTVDAHGVLTSMSTNKSTTTDASEDGHADWFANAMTNINGILADVKKRIQVNPAWLMPIPFDSIRSFVFPGAQPFTFKNATFSTQQDLVAQITYVNPTLKAQAIREPAPLLQRQGEETYTTSHVVEVSELPLTAAVVQEWRTKNGMGPTYSAPRNRRSDERSEDNANTRAAEDGIEIDDVAISNDGKDDILRSSSTSDTQTQLSSSTELMLNYVQGELVQPDGKFKALQLSAGHGLVFAADSAGVLKVFEETVGQTHTGWIVKDLSTAFINKSIAGGQCHTWDVAQSVMDNGSIAIGMAVRTDGASDVLCLSLLNSSTSTDWTSAPTWTSVPFDARDAPNIIQITNIFFSETEAKQQFILVDILQDPSSTFKATSRYIVDPSAKPGSCWQPHTLPFDVEEGTYQSCMGRVADAYVDGIYTAGTVGGRGQLGYVPLFNIAGDGPPLPTRLQTPGIASAIASSRTDQPGDLFGSTHLFAVSGSALYYWAPDQQADDDSPGQLLVKNAVLLNTDTLIALTRGGTTTIFGKNSSDVVYYTSCLTADLSNAASWRTPIPILSNIEHISSYINCQDGGNIVYAAGGNTLQQIMQSIDGSGIWQSYPITLTAPPQSKANSFMSYTTLIRTIQDGTPTRDVAVNLTSPNRTPVYINGLYYVLTKDPITVKSGQAGKINIIQATKSIVGAVISASVEGVTSTINPMEKSVAKLKTLGTSDSLKSAQIVTNTKAGGTWDTPTTSSLVASTASSDDLKAGAQGIQGLGKAYDKHSGTSGLATQHRKPRLGGIFDSIESAAGDLYNWLATGVESVIQVVEDAATGLYHFVVKIAGEIYSAVLDTVHAIVGAFEWVFKELKTIIEDVIRFLEFLFAWKDIKRTQAIMHNMCNYFLKDLAVGITELQSEVDTSIASLQKSVGELTGVDWTSLGDTSSKPPGGTAVNTDSGQSASSEMMSNHFNDHAQDMSLSGDMPGTDAVQELIESMIQALEEEGDVLSQTVSQLEDLASDTLKLPVEKILLKLVGIITESALGSAQVVLDALFNLIRVVADSAISILDFKIHIPIVSDILNALGINDLSFLDIVTWVAAAVFTLAYKVIEGSAPFPDNDKCDALASASDWKSMQAAMGLHTARLNGAKDFKTSLVRNLGDEVDSTSEALFRSGHAINAFLMEAGGGILCLEALDPTPNGYLGLPSALIGIGAAVAGASADYMVSKMPIQSAAVLWTNRATTLLTILFKGWFSGPGQKILGKAGLNNWQAQDSRCVGAVVNTILILPALICSCCHLSELSRHTPSQEQASAIMGETANLMQYFGRIAYLSAVTDDDLKTRIIPVVILRAANDVYSSLQIALTVLG